MENVLAAVCVGALLGCEPDRIRTSVRNFKAVEHRLEHVATIRGVDYYNDSKATNVDATIKAIESFPANIHLILGGKDKGSDYSVLNDLLPEACKARLHHRGSGGQDRITNCFFEEWRSRNRSLPKLWKLRSDMPPKLPCQGILFCLLPPVPASTNSATTNIAERCSNKW